MSPGQQMDPLASFPSKISSNEAVIWEPSMCQQQTDSVGSDQCLRQERWGRDLGNWLICQWGRFITRRQPKSWCILSTLRVPFRTDIEGPLLRQTRPSIVPRCSIMELYKRMFVEKTTQSPAIGSFCGMRNHGFSSAEMIWTEGGLFGRRQRGGMGNVVNDIRSCSGNQNPGAAPRNNIQTSHSSLGAPIPKDSAG
ncbi:hypothetical protein NPIL_340411 [Nephila pilipes]|uniref:Uncharacterized protein n=1 Tax=Nephila pilipes TaxID=299642 RepID=A0A8X6TKQ3_NEPPI|nr:hypothetical protein NPIL_340411 [Nephila pilipes]